MNHFVLPLCPHGDADPRYGDSAIDQLVEEMFALGCRRPDMEAKIFGGAEVLSFGEPENNVGTRNIGMALARLEHHAIVVTARRTGGENGVMVRFASNTGLALVRPILPPQLR